MSGAFLAKFGFHEDPFQSTNADDEPGLADYFIPPPYFPSVMGDPSTPKSQIVFAPRGGGKSAQRRMIEDNARETALFMCISYDHFDQPAGFKAKQATLAYHLNQICRLIVLSILVHLEENPHTVDFLNKQDKHLLKVQVDYFVGSLSAEEFQTAVSTIKTFGDKSRDFLKTYAGPIGVALEVIKNKWGLNIELPQSDEPITKQDTTMRFHLIRLVEILQKLGYDSCYVLVDKVDETAITGLSGQTFDLIRPLITDLSTLEIPRLAFKFFLWDAIRAPFDSSGYARPDRIPVYELDWAPAELGKMLASRMAAYSSRQINSFNDLVEPCDVDVHRLITLLAAGSPRNMIRLSQRIVAAATRTGEEIAHVPMSAVWAGIRAHAEEIAIEIFPTYIGDIRRVGKPTFTTKYIGSDIFRVSDNAARRKLQLWTDTGVVGRIGEIPNPPNRPLHLYGVTDARVCLAAFHQDDPAMVLGNYLFVCDTCQSVCISDERVFTCHRCGTGHVLGTATSVMDYCTKAI